ncbi:hypothetical protein CL614_03695 [archaeon]|nr:hypothetical protein [archaeon]
MAEIIVNQLDETGDEQVSEFVNQDYNTEQMVEFFKESQKKEFTTDADFEEIFTKVAEEYTPKTWEDFKGKVTNLFNGKLDTQFARWETKVALDKTRLKELFNAS